MAERAPERLGVAGLALWERVTADPAPGECLVFDVAELVTLELACRQADDIARLEDLLSAPDGGLLTVGSKGQPKLSGAVAELRLQRAALARLVAMLSLPSSAGDADSGTPAQRKARRAAEVRWSHTPRLGGKHGQAG